MKYTLIILRLSVLGLLLTKNAYSFSASRFENETCPQTLQERSNGYYSVRPPLVFQGEDTTVIQKVSGPEGRFYQAYNSQKTVRLEGDLTNIEDFVVYQEDLWILSDGELFQYSSRGRLLNRYRYPHWERYEKPLGLEVYEDSLIVAHGKLGLVQFDLKSQEFSFLSPVNTWQEDDRRSMAVAVTVFEGKAYVALTGLQQGSFNGVVSYDLGTGEILNSARYRNGREGVIDPRAKIYAHAGDIFLNNGGWIHRHEIKDLLRRRNAKPYWMSIPYQSGNLNRFLMIRGDFVFDEGAILGCAINERTPVFAKRIL